MKACISMLALLLVLSCVSVAAQPPDVSFRFEDIIVKNSLQADSYAINDSNQITGDYADSSGVIHGMILQHKLKTIDNPNGNTTQGFGINSNGDVAGWYITNNGVVMGFLYSNGQFTDINVPDSVETEATGINDNGIIVGLYVDANGVQHGFKKKGSKYTTIDIKGASTTAAWGINNQNTITVYAQDADGNYTSYALNYNGKSRVKVAVPGAGPLGTVIHTPSNNGAICMTFFDSDNGGHGALLLDGTYYPFDDPNASNSTRADGLNKKLIVVGRYSPSDGSNHGFKAYTRH